MFARFTLVLLSACGFALPSRAEKLTPTRLFSDPDLAGKTARGVALSPDGKRITYLRAKTDDANVFDLWAVDISGGEPYRLIDAKALSAGDKILSEAETARRERQRVTLRGIVDYTWDEEGRFILVPLDGDLFLKQVADGKVRRLTATPADEIDAKVSPKGHFVSFVRDQNLYTLELSTGKESAVTARGADTLSFGVADFIAQEEMNRFTGYWWSPDERQIAFTRVDESPVEIVPRADIGAAGATVVSQRYPRAGRPNAIVGLLVRDLAKSQEVEMDLGLDHDIYLARVDWSKDGRTLYAQRETRDQRTLDLIAFNVSTGRGHVVLREKSPSWIWTTDDFRALTDGNFLWSSDRSGNRHLYLFKADGTLIRQLTNGDWPVDKIEGVDEATQSLTFSASKETPIEHRLYTISYETPGEPKALTPAGGWWTARVAKTGGTFVGTYSDPSTPAQIALYAADGSRVRWIEENRLDATHPFWPYHEGLRAPEFGVLKASDGQDLHYSLQKPPDFDPKKTYPVIVNVYGGPHEQEVKRMWQSASNRVFLDAGYVLFQLDNRGSSNRSVAFQTALNRRLGTVEVEDQLIGAAFLKTLPYVDVKRMGVKGWSYGGYMTLLRLTAENSPFSAGAAGAPPTDWALYDTHYTEQFMGRPEENKEGYARADVLTHLERLKPHSLLLLHGMADDNVIFENSLRLLAALQKRNIAFETMLYPGERHSVGRSHAKGAHVLQTQLDFFDRTLK